MTRHLFRENVLSILIPVYNERAFLRPLVEKVMAVELPRGLEKEVVLVDDCSTDGTDKIIGTLRERFPQIRAFRQEKNQGKGAAIRRAIAEMTGEYAIVQDADLEYDPREYPEVLRPLLEGHADVVYGSRFAGRQMRRVLFYHHKLGNLFLTHFSNFMTGLDLTDMETCYKAFRADVLKTIPLRSNRFGIEPEITAKIAKRGCRVFEVPISYYGRGYAEGKKIGWKDGVQAIYTIIKYRFLDDCYEDRYGRKHLQDFLNSRGGSLRLAEAIRPFLGDRILEVGAGIGNLSRRLPRRERLFLVESDPDCLEILETIYGDNDIVEVRGCNPDTCAQQLAGIGADSAVCANLLQFLEDDVQALRGMTTGIAPGGRLIVAVPNGGGENAKTGARRGYSKSSLREALTAAGYEIDRISTCNFPAYLLGLLGGAATPGKFRRKCADMLQFIFRPLERILPLPGGCIVAVARPVTR